MTLSGIFAPIPTPFVDGKIAFAELGANLDKWGATGLSGIVVMGSNGEAPYVDEHEKIELWAFARKRFPDSKLVLAGTGQESTAATIRLTRAAADAGASHALVINPSYFKGRMTKAALEGFYADVAGASPIPILIYNMPGNTGVNLSSDLVVALSRHPNIAGVKDSSGNIVQISEIIHGAAPQFSVFAGSASFLLPSLLMGAKGGTLATANIAADLCVKLFRLVEEGNYPEAADLQRRLLRLNALVTAKYGVAGLKAAMDMIGYFGGLPRRPMLPATDEEKGQVRVALEELALIG